MPYKKTKSLAFALLALSTVSVYSQTIETPIHPDLITNDMVDFEHIDDQVSSEIRRLSQDNFTIQDVGVPDYKVANYYLQAKITRSLTNFFNRLDALNIKLKTDLSRVKSVDDVRTRYNSPEWQEAYELEVMKVYPKIASYLNSEYQSAIKGLYSLDNSLDLTVATGRKVDTNLFKEHSKKVNGLTNKCITKICLSRINEDVNEWIRLVDAMDSGIQFGKGKTVTERPGLNKKVNRFSIGIADFMKKTIKVGLEDNKVYTNGSAIADYAESIGKSSIGVSAGILYLPALVLDKVVNFTQGLSPSKKFIFTNLETKKVNTYKVEDAINDRNILVEKERQNLRNIAIGEDEIKQVLSDVLESTYGEKKFIVDVVKKDKALFDLVMKHVPLYLQVGAIQIECEKWFAINNAVWCNYSKEQLELALLDARVQKMKIAKITLGEDYHWKVTAENGQSNLGLPYNYEPERMANEIVRLMK